ALFIVVAALNAMAPAATLGITPTPGDERLRIARAALMLTPILVLPFAACARSAGAAVLAGAAWVAINGFAVGLWIDHNAWGADTTRVERTGVKRAACTVRREDPFVPGSKTKSISNLNDLVTRYCSR